MNDWQEKSREGKRARAHFLVDKLKKIPARFLWPVESCPRADAPIPCPRDRDERYLTYQRIIRGYIPGFYSGRVVLLRTDSIQSRVPDDN